MPLCDSQGRKDLEGTSIPISLLPNDTVISTHLQKANAFSVLMGHPKWSLRSCISSIACHLAIHSYKLRNTSDLRVQRRLNVDGLPRI